MFKPVYYLGCKASLIEPILSAIESVTNPAGRVCDMFAGSGAVSLGVSKVRPVTAVDIQEYSRVLCDAQLNPTELSVDDGSRIVTEIRSSEVFEKLTSALRPLIELESRAIAQAASGKNDLLVELVESQPLLFSLFAIDEDEIRVAKLKSLRRLEELGMWKMSDSTVTRYFGGVYFSYSQSVYLDAALSYASSQCESMSSTLKASILSVASELANTVGKQFAQPLRPRDKAGVVKASAVTACLRDRRRDPSLAHCNWLSRYGELAAHGPTNEAVRSDYLEFLSRRGSEFSAIYADPPYTRDHYSRFYHVLETMCLRDEPVVSTTIRGGMTQPSRGVYRDARHQSPFCVRSTAEGAFNGLFSKAKGLGIPVVLSYSPSETGDGTHPRVLSASQISSIAKRYYSSVDLQMIDGKAHNKHNRKDLSLESRAHAEMLMVCQP